MQTRLLLVSLTMGGLATLLAARIDDALVLMGQKNAPVVEIAADATSVMVRRRGISTVEISLSQAGTKSAASASEVFRRASSEVWSKDPLAGMVATTWVGAVQHQVLFRQGWPFDAFCASSTPEAGLKGGIALGSPGSTRTIALSPVWSGLLGNTLLFAGAFWLAITSMGLVRRVVRRRGGLCERCSYARHGLPLGAPCPECGHG